MNKKLRVFFLAVLAVVLTASMSFASTWKFTWTGDAGDGKWENPKNWSADVDTTIFKEISTDSNFYPGGSRASSDQNAAVFTGTGEINVSIAKNSESSFDVVVKNTSRTDELSVFLDVTRRYTLKINSIDVTGSDLQTATLEITGDRGLISSDAKDTNLGLGRTRIAVHNNGIVNIATAMRAVSVDVDAKGLLTLGGAFGGYSSFDVDGELALANPVVQMKVSGEIKVNDGGTLTLDAAESDIPEVILATSKDCHVVVNMSKDVTLNLPAGLKIAVADDPFFNVDGNLEVVGEGNLQLSALNITSAAESDDIFAPVMVVSGELRIIGGNLALESAPAATRKIAHPVLQAKGVLVKTAKNGDEEIPSTFTAEWATISADFSGGNVSFDLSVEKGENTATVDGKAVIDSAAFANLNSGDVSIDIEVGTGSSVTLRGDQLISSMKGDGTITSEQEEGDYLKLVKEDTNNYASFNGTLEAANVVFDGLEEYPFNAEAEINIENLIIPDVLIINSADLSNVTVYLRDASFDTTTLSADMSLQVGKLRIKGGSGNKLGSLLVDAGHDAVVPVISMDGGAQITIDEVTFYNNVDATETPYDDLKAIIISGDGTVVINSASGGEIGDDEDVFGVNLEAITVEGAKLKINGDIGDSNILINSASLDVANGVELAGLLEFKGNSKFTTELTEAQKTKGITKGAYAVTAANLTIAGTLSVDANLAEGVILNGYVKGDEWRVLGTEGEFDCDATLLSADENGVFEVDKIDNNGDGSDVEGIVVKVNKDFVTPRLGQASIEGPGSAAHWDNWDKVDRWSANQFWINVRVVSVDPAFLSNDSSSASSPNGNYLIVNVQPKNSNVVTTIDRQTYYKGEISFRGVFAGDPAEMAKEDAFTITVGLIWQNNPENVTEALVGKFSADSFVNASYDVVVLKDVVGSSDIMEAFGGTSENSTAQLSAVTNPEVNPDDDEIVFSVDGLTASTLTTTSTAMELVDGKYQPKDKVLDPIVVYSLPVEGGTRTFDEIEVLVNGTPVASEDASVDVEKSPAEVTVKVSALGYNGEVTVDKELAVRGKKSFNRNTITTGTVKFTIISTDVSFETPEGVNTTATVTASGDVEYLAEVVAPEGSEFIADQTPQFITTLPDWLEAKVTSDSVAIQAKSSVTVEAGTSADVKFTVQVVDANGNVSYKGYQWTITVGGSSTTSAYEIVATAGSLEGLIDVNAPEYALTLKVSPDVTDVKWTYDAAPEWLTPTEDKDGTLSFALAEDAKLEVTSVDFEVTATVGDEEAKVTVKVNVVDGKEPVPGGFAITATTGSLTPEVRVGVPYELVLRAESADHWMVGESEEAPEWLGFKEDGETANFTILATEAQLAESPYTFAIHAYAGEDEAIANLVVTVLRDQATTSLDVSSEISGDKVVVADKPIEFIIHGLSLTAGDVEPKPEPGTSGDVPPEGEKPSEEPKPESGVSGDVPPEGEKPAEENPEEKPEDPEAKTDAAFKFDKALADGQRIYLGTTELTNLEILVNGEAIPSDAWSVAEAENGVLFTVNTDKVAGTKAVQLRAEDTVAGEYKVTNPVVFVITEEAVDYASQSQAPVVNADGTKTYDLPTNANVASYVVNNMTDEELATNKIVIADGKLTVPADFEGKIDVVGVDAEGKVVAGTGASFNVKAEEPTPGEKGITGIKAVSAQNLPAAGGAFTFTFEVEGEPAGSVTWTVAASGTLSSSVTGLVGTASGDMNALYVVTGTVPTNTDATAKTYEITVTAADGKDPFTQTANVIVAAAGSTSPDVPGPTSPDVPGTTYTITGITVDSSDLSARVGAAISIDVEVLGNAPASTLTLRASSDISFTVVKGSGRTFTLVGTAPRTAGNYNITLIASSPNVANSFTANYTFRAVRVSSGGGGGGGCDAGFGVLALLLATPLFLRKRK